MINPRNLRQLIHGEETNLAACEYEIKRLTQKLEEVRKARDEHAENLRNLKRLLGGDEE